MTLYTTLPYVVTINNIYHYELYHRQPYNMNAREHYPQGQWYNMLASLDQPNV